MDFCAGAFAGDRTAGMALPLALVQAEVGRNTLPAHALVAGTEHAIAADIERAGIVRREHDRIGPGEAVLQVLGRDARRFLGPHIDQLDLARAMVVALQRARAARAGAHGADIDDVMVARVDGDEAALAGAGIGAVGQGDHAPFRRAGHRDRGVVLLGAVDAVGILVVDVDTIELRRLLVVDRRPRSACVERYVGAAVVALDHAARIVGVDPQIVVVAMTGGDLAEAGAAVGRLPHLQIGDVDGVGMAGVGEDVGVVPGPVHQVAIGRDLGPARAEVVGAVEAGLVALGFDQRPDAAGAGGRNGDADLAQQALRQAWIARNLLPAIAAVGAAEQPAARTAARYVPEVAPRLPHRGEQDARIGAVHGEIDRARHVATAQDLLPALAAVPGAIDAALRIGTEYVAQGRDIDEIGVLRMDADAANELAVLQTDITPRAAGIGRLVQAIAVGDVEADRRLAGTGIDHVGVRGRDRNRAQRGAGHEAVRDALPEHAAVDGLPDAAGAGAKIEHHLVGGIARDRNDAAATRGADAAPFQRLETRRGGQTGFRGHGARGADLFK